MVKRAVLVLLAAFGMLFSNAQTVGRYRYHHKDYFVYPLRLDNNSEDIPQPGFRIPDGDYVVFHNYIFKLRLFGEDKPILHDTSKVVAYVRVKNGLLNGPAAIYQYNERDNYTLQRRPHRVASGKYSDGAKDSTWKFRDLKDGSFHTAEYKNDLPNGYNLRYDKKGRLEFKGKDRNGQRIDTATFYEKTGKIKFSYDLYPDSEKTYDKNIYTIALKPFYEQVPENAPATFYRKYDLKGNLVTELRFAKGIPLPFDSVTVADVSIKVLPGRDAGQYRILQEDRSDKKTLVHTEDDYTSLEQYKHVQSTYYKKQHFTLTNGYELFAMDTTLSPDVPQLIVKDGWSFGTDDQTFFIPKYRFAYLKAARGGITYIDTTGPFIYMSDTAEASNNVQVVEKTRSMPRDSFEYRYVRYSPYLSQEFLTNERFPKTDKDEGHHYSNNKYMYSNNKYLPEITRDYSNHTMSTQYFKDHRPLRGKVILVPYSSHRHAGDSVMEVDAGTYNELSGGRLLDGKKQGVWENLSGTSELKHSGSLRNYFLSNSSQVDGYYTTSYDKGLRSGHEEHLAGVFKDDIDGPFSELSKEKRKALWKKNLSRSKKIFVYKSDDYYYENDTLNGPYRTYYSNTAPETEMTFWKGRPHGDYRRYSENGRLLASGHFENGKLDGPFYTYDSPMVIVDTASTGSLKMKAMFKNNLLEDTLFYYNDGVKPYMAFKLRNDTLLFKRQYFNSRRLQEDITFSPQSGCAITENLLEASNYFDIISSSGDNELRKADADYRSYYEDGGVLAEGRIVQGYPGGDWKFYNINGTLIHQIDFTDTNIMLPGATKAKEISGFYTGYYSNGKIRCRGYLKDIELSYDCFVKQDKPNLDFYVMDFYDMSGNQTVSNGSGNLVKYDEDGLRMASGKLVSCIEDSVWRYYTPEQKLTSIGNYAGGRRDGVWYDGDLENINFEDGACFDRANELEMSAYERKRKELYITKTVYINGVAEKVINFSSDLNKTYGSYRVISID